MSAPDRETLAKRMALAAMLSMEPELRGTLLPPTETMWAEARQEDKDTMLALADEAIAYMKEINNDE